MCPLNATEAAEVPVVLEAERGSGLMGVTGYFLYPTSCTSNALAEHSESQDWSNLAVLASDG